MRAAPALSLLLVLFCCSVVRAQVVINEILYHAPDDLVEVQFIELFNSGKESIDLSGWKLTRGVTYSFPAKTTLGAGGYLIVCKNQAAFKKYYGFAASAEFTGSLSKSKGKLELVDSKGKVIDRVEYGSRAPWPVAPDGYSSSLERISPEASGTLAENWAPSPFPERGRRPSGTPGKQNANYSKHLPPVISKVTYPTSTRLNQPIRVEMQVSSKVPLESAELRYRVAGTGFEKGEQTVVMKESSPGVLVGEIPGQKAGQLIRFVVSAQGKQKSRRWFPSPYEIRPACSVYVHDQMTPAKIPWGLILNVGKAGAHPGQGGGSSGFSVPFFSSGTSASLPGRGSSAFIYVEAGSGKVEVFDYIHVTPRKGGRKVRFHKDRTLQGMTTINLIYEYMDRFVLAESLAYEVYHKAGNGACRTDFVRTWIDGQPLGFQLLVEQPNKSFLRRQKLRTDGNMYKLIWYGFGVVGQHEKKTNVHSGHRDLVELLEKLNKTSGEEQWGIIKKHFDVEQVINYFAVNTLLSHWDGFFNNYFTYHDVHGSGKWTMYPWDQDKTWGFHDGIQGYDVFTDMPITFGMNGDRPVGGAAWWRQPGHFSGPLLANARFRKLYLARLRELLDKVYTEEEFFPRIKTLGERLEPEVRYRAELRREDPKRAVAELHRNLETYRVHLKKRRAFLLAQPEVQKAEKFDRRELR